jgi:hypothetical protein
MILGRHASRATSTGDGSWRALHHRTHIGRWVATSDVTGLRYIALNGSGYRSYAEQGETIARYLRCPQQNAPANAKRKLCPISVIITRRHNAPICAVFGLQPSDHRNTQN